jgi:chromosome segregation ATPase
MGVYSSQAAACNEYLDSAISKLNALKANQEATINRLKDNQDVVAEGVSKSCAPIKNKIDTVISTISSLQTSISAKAAELDAALEEEERKKREAEKNN